MGREAGMVDIVCFGEALVDLVSDTTGLGLAEAERFVKVAGGAPANVAVGLARLGISCAFMGMVGDDPFGSFLTQTLSSFGVDTGSLRVTAAAPTTLALVSVTHDAEREFVFYGVPGADTLMSMSDVDGQVIAQARGFHFGSLSLAREPCRSAVLYAAAIARDQGCMVSCDLNLRLALWPDAAAARLGLQVCLDLADVLKVNEEELAFLTGEPVQQHSDVQCLFRSKTKLVVVTRGKKGCLWFTRHGKGSVPGFHVQAVDTTGAGDAFMAGLLAGLLDAGQNFDAAALPEMLLHKICRMANACGALATTTRGATSSRVDQTTVEALIAGRA